MNFPTLAAYTQALSEKPLRYEPGSTWLYGSSHHVLGYLVQQVSGVPLDKFVQEKILTPLGMQDTRILAGRRQAARHPGGQRQGRSCRRFRACLRRPRRRRRSSAARAACNRTAADYWRFSQMLLNGGTFNGHRILGPRTIRWMAENHIGDIPSFTTPGTRFGLGLAVVTDPGSVQPARTRRAPTTGAARKARSSGSIPPEDLVGVLMVQLTPSRLKLREKFSALVYGAILE